MTLHTDDELFREPGTTGLDQVIVRRLEARDLEAVLKIDARHSGRSRRGYYERKFAEATRESGVTISLVAELDGRLAGFLIGRLYYGEFGVPEPMAIVDSIGVDAEQAHRHVGSALFSQLETNLRALRVTTLRTEVPWSEFGLLGFLKNRGFSPVPVLTLEKRIS
jgi:ribosomal protein S18 acetylase RimI-like enzyme